VRVSFALEVIGFLPVHLELLADLFRLGDNSDDMLRSSSQQWPFVQLPGVVGYHKLVCEAWFRAYPLREHSMLYRRAVAKGSLSDPPNSNGMR
jgi:hypothetical protein